MSEAYDRILKSKTKPQRIARGSRKLISLDDSIENDDENPNIFQINDSRIGEALGTENEMKLIGNEKANTVTRKGSNLHRETMKKEQKMKRKSEERPPELNSKKQLKPVIEIVDDEQIDQYSNDQQSLATSHRKTLNIRDVFNLYLGHFFHSYSFPLRRQIPIIASTEDLQRQKYENGSYISEAFDNNLQVSFWLFFVRTVLVQSFVRISHALWLVAVILSYAYEFKNSVQYSANKEILLSIYIFYVVLSIILQYLSVKERRNWNEPCNSQKYRVYHYDEEHRTAEWILTSASDLRPGNIYKIPPSQDNLQTSIPADSVLLHSSRTIVQVDQSPIIQYLSPLEKQEKITLKETVIKSDVILLPLTGVIEYELQAPEIRDENIEGRMKLQQPIEIMHKIGYSNILLRGTKILALPRNQAPEASQTLGIVLQTGIDSIVLKNSQYPFQYRLEYPISKLLDILHIVASVMYLIITGVGILIGYIYLKNSTIVRGYYIEDYYQNKLSIGELTVHHFVDYIMMIPLLLRIAYLLYINIVGRVVNRKLKIKVKDMEILGECIGAGCDVLVTTIGGDLIRMGSSGVAVEQQGPAEQQRNSSLQSIVVKQIHHNFLTTSIEDEKYSTEDVDMLCYFMSVALLTCQVDDLNKLSPLQSGIMGRCSKDLGIKVEKQNANGVIKIGQFKVTNLFTIPASEKYPFKVVFYKHGKDIVEDVENVDLEDMEEPNGDGERDSKKSEKSMNEKVLCLVRGEPSVLGDKNNEAFQGFSDYSTRLHQEKGFHIEMLGKFVISYQQFIEIRKAYTGASATKYSIQKFYLNLKRFMLKLDTMGLLIWNNPYGITSTSLLPISSLFHPYYKIIIAPLSRSQTNPEFESIHAITNYLLKTFKLPLSEISNKILHDYTNKEIFWACLREQKVLVLNGWDNCSIKKMLVELRETEVDQNRKRGKHKESYMRDRDVGIRGIRSLGYIEQDEYAWILKQTSVSIVTRNDGHDLEKYGDICIEQSSSSTTQTLGKLFQCSHAIKCNLINIAMIHFSKSIMLGTIQFINGFYTWGTGLLIFSIPLYLILEIGLLFDVAYYAAVTISSTNSKSLTNPHVSSRRICLQVLLSLLLGAFITLIPVYSTTTSPSSSGSQQPKQFTSILIFFILYHSLIFRKLFLSPSTITIYKLLILLAQIAVFYIGLIIISQFDVYQYKGILWYVLKGKIILVGIFCVWMAVGIWWLQFMLETILLGSKKTKDRKQNVYKKIEGDNEKNEQQRSVISL